ncbi:TetR/AcrR family transcriptional regulator [Amycolatopsis jiangsuensis]|uniref:AcrR family transcriptional regulator n=1 Tax=Amycolatopsis jiangsuensis TaxID=1181879 RepID=A0A840ISV1_9PSEU|nr:TetR/AcrR family transcriptional regulator [Amycolatopsis jiangsuensis]MBB4685701.1 AcrR family transcriptional regulator [Amycolatopsis jiangsuensis]
MAGRRADALRNQARILAVAEREVAAHGAEISLERVARVAGVGSGTVRRHFPGRQALLEAVFRDRIDALCARAGELTDVADARTALLEWLGLITVYEAEARGMAKALLPDHGSAADDGCATKLTEATEPLLSRAVREGVVAPEVTAKELLTLVAGFVLATEDDPSAARRLLALAVDGISPRR